MSIPMPAPICLIENSPAGELQVQQEALKVLAEISQPVVVVAIAGLYRTGKSYLMNKLASKRTGFSLGSTIQSHTKGIWMWCLPHPRRAGHTLVLLDTEGLGDVEKGDAKNDTWIFALAVLLSSTLVYNSLGTINQQAMDQLHYVTELTERIKVKAAGRGSRQEGEDSAEFVRFFPAFVWAVRDFTLQLELDGQKITEDEYLENGLKLKPGSSQRAQLYNLPRECIRQFFPARKCFVFVQPAGRRDLARLEELREDELEPEFREQVAQFCRHVWEMSKPKTIPGGHVVTGGTRPNLPPQAHVERLTHLPHSGPVMARTPAPSAPPPHPGSGLPCLCPTWQRRLEEQKQELCQRNEVASSDRCKAALLELSDELDDRIGEGVYSVPGGYQRFLDDRQRMVDRYWQVPGKGVKAEEVLQEFLQSKAAVAQSILQTDEALTEKEKEMAAERARAEAAEREQQVLKQKEAELQQKLEDQDRSYQENLRQLETKLKDERKKLLEEQGKMMDQKLKVPGGPRVLGAAGDGWADLLRSTLALCFGGPPRFRGMWGLGDAGAGGSSALPHLDGSRH
uniref:GB1/RHD3-type G domain-containing protein n=1 Tax=Chrysemys picta bellii TaxID=8478 RepID=A0A8C3HM88_CHRPI